MSWFQNLLQRFKNDEEEEFYEEDIHNVNLGGHPAVKEPEGSKELEARISYQYPKLNMTYPSTPSPLIHKKRREERSEERNHSHKEEVQPVEIELPKKRTESVSKMRTRPFHPTEIPSPVYGFNRPKAEKSSIEHEISHFHTVQPVQASDPSIKKDEVKAEPVIVKPVLATVENNPVQEPEENHDAITEPAISRRRNHLPFNVMMLKQDKRIWEERKQTRHIVSMKEQIPEIKESEQKNDHDQELGKIEHRNILVQEIAEMERKNAEVHLLTGTEQVKEHIPSISANEQQQETDIDVKSPESLVVFPEKHDVHRSESANYQFPLTELLNPPVFAQNDTEWVHEQADLLNQTLINFNVGASVVNVTQGPSVTRFEVQPEPGVKVNKITKLNDDIKLSLAAKDIRIEAPIPGKHTIGIEVPNKQSRPVCIREIVQNHVFEEASSPLTAVLGLDISGKPIVTDLKKMPHGLIAGATGSGKSVCINSIIVSLLYKASPEDLKLLLIDPKMVELAPYNHIPHLVSPVITDVKAATAALKWAVDEMERRYELFAHTGVRDINRFNEMAIKHKQYSDKLPFIVIIIDELADLMMMSPADVEEAICRIAQKARACGIHLIVATQRPSVDVITGLIKANIPTRIAFSVSSQIDSRTIIDISGAEKLLGRGDMLFLENGSSKPVRLQGTFVTDDEIELIVAHVKEQQEPDYLFHQEELLKKAQVTEEEDELFYDACEYIVDQGGASTSSLQRRFKIGYNRAARLMEMLEKQGFISGANGSKPREVLITQSDLEAIQENVFV